MKDEVVIGGSLEQLNSNYGDADLTLRISGDPSLYLISGEIPIPTGGEPSMPLEVDGDADLAELVDGEGVPIFGLTLIQLSATANGTYTPPSGKAYSSVDVAVQPTLVKYGIRPDATLVQTYTYDKWMNADESITIPGYSTSAQTIKASEALDTITLDRDNYYYRVVERMLTIPTYSVTTHNKGRCEYHIGAHVYEVIDIPASSLHSLIEPTRYYTSRLNTITTTMASYREVYYSAQTTLSTYSTQAYGVCQAAVAPTMSSGKLTINSPTVTCRGSTTYFVNTYANAVTDVRAQYIIEVYKVPKNNLNIEAWANDQLMKQIIASVNSNTQTLK